ncbi:bifunctional diaminohydroxyphosphoribosylaminopyrimidine deaminase/5-amino-6-(5-phosphoribosylamino)uracil reductase RibD [Enterococcus rotai]|uniref:bifunctional diaminohydroxyphosphoribosylaminopyrimidine deaminase/5-amino-6-(5-phosphoribosylamino)uracil reductase RibD n=1 Tax=Enterococcus rotai TaxID=118060 RepID=UPI003F4973CD
MHEAFMELAILEAKKGKGKTFTNPLVGAVIVSENEVISKSAHLKYGQEHAEKNAINLCKTPEKLLNSTIYVTLEPCDHYGKQPPCTQVIIDSGIKCVVIGQHDPNPLVSGKGVEKLREQGVYVIIGVLEKEVRDLNEHYNHFFEKHRPFVSLKQAMSLDGKISLREKRTNLTQKKVFERVHEERGDYQAILVGSETIIIDDPLLLSTKKSHFPPVRIVLDRRGRVLSNSKLRIFKNATAPVLIFTEKVGHIGKLPKHVEVCYFSSVTVQNVLNELHKRNIQSVYVEGGSVIHDAFLASDYWDEIICYVAPLLLGGNSLSSMSSNRESNSKTPLKFVDLEKIGSDFRIVGRRV